MAYRQHGLKWRRNMAKIINGNNGNIEENEIKWLAEN
jgi:hypothetical protein